MGWYQRRVHGECWSGGDRRDTENWKFGGLSRLQSEKTVRIFDKLFAAAQLEQTNFRYSFSSFSVSLSSLSALVSKNYICLLLIYKPLTSVNRKKTTPNKLQ